MSRSIGFLCLTAAAVVGSTDARAGFVLQGTPPPIPSLSPPPAAPVVPHRGSPARSWHGAGAVPAKPAVPSAVGFGVSVPLRVAAGMIVPAGWAVTYGEGTDPEMAVNWNGGKPWPDALRDAVRPLGLGVELSPARRAVRLTATSGERAR